MTCKGWRNKYEMEEEVRNHEVNGNSCRGKRKRSHLKKHCGYLQEWLDKSYAFQQQPDGPYGYDEPVHRVPGVRPTSCWPNHPTVPLVDRRLFPTTSEPTVCRYSLPVGYSLEPISLPVYAAYVPMPEAGSSRRRGKRPASRYNGSSSSVPPPTQSNWYSRRHGRRQTTRMHPMMNESANDEFTSLPPAASSHTPDTVRRRFSDPGIGRPPDVIDGGTGCCTGGSTDSGDTCSRVSTPEAAGGTNNALVLSLVEQVSALQFSNKQLCQQLRETKAELDTLKQSWCQMSPEYEPGMLSDMIREIRDAARVREEVLLSRVCSMLEEVVKGKPINHVVTLPEMQIDNIEQKLQHLHIHKEKVKSSNLTETNEDKESQTEQLCALEMENLRLRRGLQEAVAKNKDRETQAQQLEHLVDVLQRKMNMTSSDEKPASSDQSPTESLVSTASSSSTTHSPPQVTMSGPVTDL